VPQRVSLSVASASRQGPLTGANHGVAAHLSRRADRGLVTHEAIGWRCRCEGRPIWLPADNMPWQNREGTARALNIAATVLGL
jgi:hypothetical protein